MRTKLFAVIALVLCSANLHAQRQLQLLVAVTDPNGGEVTAIDAADVRVLENGVEGKVVKVDVVDRMPKVQVLIDNGIGMPPESIADLRTGVRGLLQALPPNIEVTMVTTAPQPRFLERATTDREKLLKAVDRLAPDSGAGRFVESLYEAMDRIAKDKQQDAAYTIITVGTSSGDTNVRESDLKQTMERLQKYRPVVYATILTRTSSGGVIQAEVAQAAAQATGGRFENINVANRLATLLSEWGAQVATTMAGGTARQFRLTVERSNGAAGELGKVQVGVAGKLVSSVSVERK